MPDALAAPHFTALRTVVAPVIADVADPAMATGVLMRGFPYVAVYWHTVGAADADTLTCRILFLDEQAAVNPLVGLVWMRTEAVQLQRGVRYILPCLGSRVQVRIDAFSNPGVDCNVFIAGATSMKG